LNIYEHCIRSSSEITPALEKAFMLINLFRPNISDALAKEGRRVNLEIISPSLLKTMNNDA
jgi:hypothetical protein